jgi:hypothetical protein
MNTLSAHGSRDDVFADLVDVLLPGRGGTVVVLQAYFDASERPGGVYCVAGFAFAKEQVKKFNRDWWRLFGKFGGCHMKELAHGVGRFKGVDIKPRGLLQIEAVKIIRKRITYGVIVSCDKIEIESILPKWIDGFQGAYPVCCHMAMTTLGYQIEKSKREDDVAYVFESGDRWSGAAHKFMGHTEDSPELKRSYRHRSHSFVRNEDALALQAADMLAWEWTKFRDETLIQRKRAMRKSLKALVGPNGAMDKNFDGRHLSGDPLRRFCELVTNLGLLQIQLNQAKDAKR